MSESRGLREALVEKLVARGALRTAALRAAFTSVARDVFVPDIAKQQGLAYVYEDRVLVTQERHGVPTSSSSQPAIMALMLEALGVASGDRVLEIGLGTGYNAALLAHLTGPGGSVTSIDIDEDVVGKAEDTLRANGFRVTTAVADGRAGYPPGAPYDRIIVAASTETVPLQWWQQLAPNGILVVPLRLDALQIIGVLVRTEEGFRSRDLIPGGFMPLRDPADPDAPESGESHAMVLVRTSLPGKQPESLSATGPALTRMSPLALRRFVGHILLDAARTRVPAVEGVPLIWYTALTSDPGRHLTVYLDFNGIRFGLADLQSGACSTFVVERVGDGFTLVGIDTFGPDPTGVDELLAYLQRWIDSGSPSMDRLSVEVSYTGGPSGDVLRTIEHGDHRISFSWV